MMNLFQDVAHILPMWEDIGPAGPMMLVGGTYSATKMLKSMKKCYVSVLISVLNLSFYRRIQVNLVPAAAAKQMV